MAYDNDAHSAAEDNGDSQGDQASADQTNSNTTGDTGDVISTTSPSVVAETRESAIPPSGGITKWPDGIIWATGQLGIGGSFSRPTATREGGNADKALEWVLVS